MDLCVFRLDFFLGICHQTLICCPMSLLTGAILALTVIIISHAMIFIFPVTIKAGIHANPIASCYPTAPGAA